MAVSVELRKKSPRAPSIPLDDALERASKIYEQERIHPAPADVIAQHMGYKDANSGRALAALASLRYYGLLERNSQGNLAVTKDVESFKYAPNDELRRSYVRRFLTTPPVFAELLDRYGSELPSEANLRYELIQRGFLPAAAETLVGVLKKSLEFANGFQAPAAAAPSFADSESPDFVEDVDPSQSDVPASREVAAATPVRSQPVEAVIAADAEHDRIPVRLAGGRRAWLVIPPVLYARDKERLKAQIDLLLTEDDEA